MFVFYSFCIFSPLSGFLPGRCSVGDAQERRRAAHQCSSMGLQTISTGRFIVPHQIIKKRNRTEKKSLLYTKIISITSLQLLFKVFEKDLAANIAQVQVRKPHPQTHTHTQQQKKPAQTQVHKEPLPPQKNNQPK